MKRLSVTWIAPVIEGLEQLAWLDELGRIERVPNVEVHTLTGSSMSVDDLAAVLGRRTDVVVWSGHGVANGLMLPGGLVVRARWLAGQLSEGARASLAVLAACGSQSRDDQLQSLTATVCRAGVNVVGFPAKADDMAAGLFTVEMIRALAIGQGIGDAFEVALDCISNEQTAMGVFLTPGLVNSSINMTSRLDEIDERLERIELALAIGHPDAPEPEPMRVPASRSSYSRSTHIQPIRRGP